MGLSGGGGYKPPPDNSLAVAQSQQEYADRSKQQEAQAAADKAARDSEAFATNTANASNDFRQRSSRRLNDMGLGGDQYNSLIEDAITGARSATPVNDPNPSQYYSDSLLDNSIARTQGDRRTNYNRLVSSTFAPNFENNSFSDNADDPFIEAVLGRQKGETIRALDMAKNRGNLDDQGYNSALSRVGEMEKAGRSTANTLGGSVIQGYRKQVRDIADTARNDASGYTLGGAFDVGNYKQQADQKVADLGGRLEGDVNNALSGQNFFDIGDILTRGSNAQGAVNPSLNLPAILAERERVWNANRGTGSTGVF
jgi:hypothetical protein